MNKGYFLAEPLPNGAPGRPIGCAGSSGIIMFDSFAGLQDELKEIRKKYPKVKVFEFNMSLVGEVVSA